MNKRLFLIVCLMGQIAYGLCQKTADLSHYIACAKDASPLLKDYNNQKKMSEDERQRLKMIYNRATVEVSGSYLLVPTIAVNNGRTSLSLDAHDGSNYYGYDLGQKSSDMQAGVTYRKPLLGNIAYKVADQQLNIDQQINDNNSKLTLHDLEKIVTEQYLLCLLDKEQINYEDSVELLINRLSDIVFKMVSSGYMNMTNYQLLKIEKEHNHEILLESRQMYKSHLYDLNILCGINDTTSVTLENVSIPFSSQNHIESTFLNKYRLDSLSVKSSLRSFDLQYKPQMYLFVDGGVNSGRFCDMPRRLGVSAGITFSWLIPDMKHKRLIKKESEFKLNTISGYKQNFILQNKLQKNKCLDELKEIDKRCLSMRNELEEYNRLLANYDKQLEKGNLSIVDYVVVLRNRIELKKNMMVLQSDRSVLINSYNYWNW
ncbi:MAG: TolC family protein [Bacteroidales bacterium]|nr:TolC family protein [Bacteroidales bacterium]